MPTDTASKSSRGNQRDPLTTDRYTDLAGSIVKHDPAAYANSSYLSGQTLIFGQLTKWTVLSPIA